MSVWLYLVILFGSCGIVVLIVELIQKPYDRKVEANRDWRQIKKAWVDVNSGQIKYNFEDEESGN